MRPSTWMFGFAAGTIACAPVFVVAHWWIWLVFACWGFDWCLTTGKRFRDMGM